MTATPLRPCPHPDKVAFDSEAAAWAAMYRMDGPPRNHKPDHPYLCGCGRWHLTSQRPNRRRRAGDE